MKGSKILCSGTGFFVTKREKRALIYDETERRAVRMQSMEEIYRQHAQTVYRYLLAQTRSADLAPAGAK